jgi:hypothetical protein
MSVDLMIRAAEGVVATTAIATATVFGVWRGLSLIWPARREVPSGD